MNLEKVNDWILSMQTIKVKEKLLFYRLLSTMTNAWMSLVKSVSVLEKQEKNPLLKKILNHFIEELKSWKTLSNCLSLYPKSFSDSEIWIINSWEKTWRLNTVLLDLSEQIEKISSISWKLKSAMIYPAFIILVVIWVIFVMMVMVVPKLLEIFSDKSKLPASTQILIAVSDFCVNYWYVIIIFVLAIVLFVKIWKKTSTWKYMWDQFMLKIPVFWELNKKLILSKFSRTLSWLMASWVSIVESFRIVSDTLWNEVYRQRVLLIMEDIQQWIKIWESLDWDKLFPPMMVQMIQVWEQTAKLDQTIIKVAEFYDEQVDNMITTLNKLLEPMIIVFLAVAVWSIAMAIMQPIMNLAETVSEG